MTNQNARELAANVQQLLVAAQAAAAAGQHQRAYDLATHGIQFLGSSYEDVRVLDNTNVKRLAAEDQLRQGNLPNAASTMVRVLQTRLQILAGKPPEPEPPPT